MFVWNFHKPLAPTPKTTRHITITSLHAAKDCNDLDLVHAYAYIMNVWYIISKKYVRDAHSISKIDQDGCFETRTSTQRHAPWFLMDYKKVFNLFFLVLGDTVLFSLLFARFNNTKNLAWN